ncbi:MAG TPA: 2-oxoglutarate dehydrogenase E1 component [Longimicrobiaceae bacterium]|nr:2-oxoglutarate dehydrogenase E1 component [Longimicrobiaceae bacterium]
MSDLRAFHGPNAGYVLGLYERFQEDPQSVDPSWRSYFQSFSPPAPEAPSAPPGRTAVPADVRAIVAAHELAASIRARGHTAAKLSPLNAPPALDPALRPEAHGLSAEELAALPASIVGGPVAQGAASAREAMERLRATYSGTAGYEFEHIVDPGEREWLREAVETGRFRSPLGDDEKRSILRRLSQVEGFEKYLHKAFFGQKRFSIEGTDMMVPMLDEVIIEAGRARTRDVVIGMAHRGRLNVLTHVLEKPYALMIGGFAGAGHKHPLSQDDLTGDVKYHMGWRTTREIEGRDVHVTLSPNPSHLEYVDPVVVGMTRAAQDDTSRPGTPTVDTAEALAVLIHGDAAFPGQGVVSETLNMSQIPGYCVGGSLHLIVNNQIGFTTLPEDDRSTRYASDLAKGFEIPVVHVNADDPEACLAVIRLAYAYRERFHKDFVVDLVGYRRWGHNEGDEPSFTQPQMYETIRSRPTARDLWVEKLVAEGIVTKEEADEMLQRVMDELAAVQQQLEEDESAGTIHARADIQPRQPARVETGLPEAELRELNEELLARPEGFAPHPRLAKQLERRRAALDEGGIDWGHAESLALASLLTEGVPVRITGQDAERGTFSHRHLVLHDGATGADYDVLASLPDAKASFEVRNSPLSEMSVVGFEYGYSVFDPDVLVIWEAQFGDFANGAQVMIDQFIAASYQKWEQRSGLVLLLPHGYEGQGPEHSSARLERFLQLAAEGNLRVVNCTTAAQYFHLLRRQAALLRTDPRPLVVMSPKSLLRHPMAASSLEDLAQGHFHPVLGDESVEGREDEVTRLLLCSGKVYVDLAGAEQRTGARNVALARVEELYPFPEAHIREQMARFPALREVVWVQEEPRNMGAWSFVFPRLLDLAGSDVTVRYDGRPYRASPAEGYASQHGAEQSRIVSVAWEGAPEPQRVARPPAVAAKRA